MKPITRIRSRTAVLADENVDTDRIIPAGSANPEFALNRPEAAGCSILVAGRNFGCGSSREHAPWALLDYGIQAVISSEIADIFRNNALKNGLLAIVLGEPVHRWLLAHPGVELGIDVVAETITLPDGREFGFRLEPFARHCLLEGVDQLGFLLQQGDLIDAFIREREGREAAIHGRTAQESRAPTTGAGP